MQQLLRSWPNAVMHLDGDAFFASCEQSVDPALRGKPVITGQERNIVASMSYEAKALGVKRATALWQTRKICPQVIILPSDYELYSLISKRMFSILRRFSPVVEESSIDEGYADLQGLRRLYHMGYDGIALKIKETIEKELRITVSVGLSLTKTLAKLAAKFKKPQGFTVVRGRHLHHFLKQIPVGEVCGIGPNTTALLQKRKITTAYDYVSKSEIWMKALWGKIGVELWHELRGNMIYRLNTEAKATYESISKTKTFTPPSGDPNYVKARLLRNVESALIKARRYKLRAKSLVIYLREKDFKSIAIEGAFNRATASPLEVFPLIEELFVQIFNPDKWYRSTGVILLKLEEDLDIQFELFEDPIKMLHKRELSKSIDAVNQAYGKHTVFSAAGLFLKKSSQDQMDGRHALPKRKTELLKGETFRRRLKVPLWQIRV